MMNELSVISIVKAEQYFTELAELYEKDGGALWGVNLNTPVILVDAQSRECVANQPDPDGKLTKHGNVYVGLYPDDLVVSNSSIVFGGQRWAIVIWDSIMGYANNRIKRLGLLTHEAFHCLQPSFQMHTNEVGDNEHLEESDARISIMLECAALIKALRSTDVERFTAVCDALSIRNERRKKYASSKFENEREIVEGLAVYTETRLLYDNLDEITRICEDGIGQMQKACSLKALFGYYTGALYGFILDVISPSWKKRRWPYTDLGHALMEACNITLIKAYDEVNLEAYGYSMIAAYETDRAEAYTKMLEGIANAFTNQPTLTIDEKSQIAICAEILSLPHFGTVFRGSIESIGSFGKLIVRQGDSIYQNDRKIIVIASDLKTEGNRVYGPHWTLELNSNYTIAEHNGRYSVIKKV